jgi:hypothetical protein
VITSLTTKGTKHTIEKANTGKEIKHCNYWYNRFFCEYATHSVVRNVKCFGRETQLAFPL